MFCTRCGTSLQEGSSFCTSCGAQLSAQPERFRTVSVKVLEEEAAAQRELAEGADNAAPYPDEAEAHAAVEAVAAAASAVDASAENDAQSGPADPADPAGEGVKDAAVDLAEDTGKNAGKDPAYSGTVDIFSTSQVAMEIGERAKKIQGGHQKSTNGIDVLVADTFRNTQQHPQVQGQPQFQPYQVPGQMPQPQYQVPFQAQYQVPAPTQQQFAGQGQFQAPTQFYPQQGGAAQMGMQMPAYAPQGNAQYAGVPGQASENSGSASQRRSRNVIIGAVAACLIVLIGLGAFGLSRGTFSSAESEEQTYFYNSSEMIDVGPDTVIKPYDNGGEPLVSYTAKITPVDTNEAAYTVHTLEIDGSGGFSLGQVPGITSDYYYIEIEEKGHSGASMKIGPIRKGSIKSIGGDDVLQIKFD